MIYIFLLLLYFIIFNFNFNFTLNNIKNLINLSLFYKRINIKSVVLTVSMTIFKIIGRCSNHLALVKFYFFILKIFYLKFSLLNLRDLSLIGRVSNCHLEEFQFESGRSRLIFINLKDLIIT